MNWLKWWPGTKAVQPDQPAIWKTAPAKIETAEQALQRLSPTFESASFWAGVAATRKSILDVAAQHEAPTAEGVQLQQSAKIIARLKDETETVVSRLPVMGSEERQRHAAAQARAEAMRDLAAAYAIEDAALREEAFAAFSKTHLPAPAEGEEAMIPASVVSSEFFQRWLAYDRKPRVLVLPVYDEADDLGLDALRRA